MQKPTTVVPLRTKCKVCKRTIACNWWSRNYKDHRSWMTLGFALVKSGCREYHTPDLDNIYQIQADHTKAAVEMEGCSNYA